MKFDYLLTVKYMPRWAIVLMDLTLVFFGVVVSFLLRFNFNTESIDNYFFIRGIVASLLAYSLSFVLFRSYKELIRHTTLHDTVKLLYTSFAASAVLLAANFIYSGFENSYLLPVSVILINFFASFFLLSAIRMLIKGMFVLGARTEREPVLIFGAGNIGQAAFKTIVHDLKSKWKVVAFVDDSPYKTGKTISGVPVYSVKDILKHEHRFHAKRLIFAVKNISIKRRNEVASCFIDRGYKVSYLPAASLWLDGSLKTEHLKDIKIEDLLEREPITINNEQISHQLKSKRILITGAAGSIGSEIVRQVIRFQPELVILCDVAESPLHAIGLELEESYKGICYEVFIGNITDAKRMVHLFDKYQPHIVFHAAAYKHVPMMEAHPQEAVINNVYGTKVIADLAVRFKAERFVMVSTDKAVNPTNIMGASKRLAEIYIQGLNDKSSTDFDNSTLFITTRFGNVLGSNGSVIPRFKAQLEKGGPLTVTHPEITRFFMTIPEACQLVLEAGVMGKGGEIFVFDMGNSIKVVDLARKMITLAGLKPDVDIKIVYTGLRPGEKLYEEVLSDFETCLPTYNDKIKIAQVRSLNYDYIIDAFDHLFTVAKRGNEWECVEEMKKIIPEFISNNSRFQKLDRERKTISLS